MADKFFLAVFGARAARALHAQYDFRAAWSMMASYNGFATQRFCKKTGLPYLLTLQEGDPIEYILEKVRFVRGWFARIFSDASALQAISTYLLNWGKDMGFAGKTAAVVPNGVDIEKFTIQHTKAENKRIVCERLNLPADSHLVITASRLVKKNGVGDLIAAMAALPTHTHLLIAGVGELEESLREQVREHDLDARVHFLGLLSHDELPQYLWGSDVFCRPSLSEGLGNVFLEAIAAGLPIVGTPVGGIPDFLEDGKTGFMCTPEDAASIAYALEQATNMNDDERQAMNDHGMVLIREQYNWTSVSTRMRELFTQL